MPHEMPHAPKATVCVALRTPGQLIVGEIHVRPHKRLKDEVNLISERFLAVTDAWVYDPGGTRLIYRSAFMLISSAHLVSITPTNVIEAEGLAWHPKCRPANAPPGAGSPTS